MSGARYADERVIRKEGGQHAFDSDQKPVKLCWNHAQQYCCRAASANTKLLVSGHFGDPIHNPYKNLK